MAGEVGAQVATCIPLHLFRREAGGRRPRPQEVCRRLAEDLNALAAASALGAPTGGASASDAAPRPGPAPARGSPESPAVPSPGGGDASLSEREQLLRSVSEDVQRQLQAILEVLEEAAERGERAAAAAAAAAAAGQDGSGGGGGGSAASTSSAGGAPPAGSLETTPPDGAADFLSQFLAADLPAKLVANLADLDFEVRKDVISVFSTIVRLGPQLGADEQIQEYARGHPAFFQLLVDGYARPEIATHCGMMLRSCARHRRLVESFLSQPEVASRLLSYTSHTSFDVSSDAFSSLHDFLLIHKTVSAAFLEANFQDFFRLYNSLLQTDDYVTQRQALKLLSDMLLDRTFMRVMLMYIGDEQFLQIHMNLLRADSKAIQFEAFHVFKIFVANPQKPPRVQQILFKNKEKLVKLLETLRPNRPDDKQFGEDKSTVIGKLQALEPVPPRPSGAGGPSTPAGSASMTLLGEGAGAGAATEGADVGAAFVGIGPEEGAGVAAVAADGAGAGAVQREEAGSAAGPPDRGGHAEPD